MNINELQNKRIAILGFGINNQKLVDFLIKNRVKITICDQDKNKNIKLPSYLINSLIDWRLGDDYLNNLIDFDIVFRSPGIPYLNKKIQEAKKKGVEVSSQTKLFFQLCPAMIIGVTGTKGKGTTSTLIYKILKKSGKKVYLAGNIGKDPFEYLKKLKKTDIVVLELSSFQLQDLNKSPHIAVVLNIAVDHLDYHKDRAEYVEAKKSITKFQRKNDYVVVNSNYQDSKEFAKISQSKNLYFSTRKKIKNGCYYKDSWLYLVINNKEYQICLRRDIKLLGDHNLENVLAGITAVSSITGVSIGSIQQVIKSFRGLEHRLEHVGTVCGVKYYNDSFSTTPETSIAAINSFDNPTVLIAGGSDKAADFDILAQEIIDNKIKILILIGDISKKIFNSLKKIKNSNTNIKSFGCGKKIKIDNIKSKYNLPVIVGCTTMSQIIKISNKLTEKGDIVLLSPACASFGMFKNYKERGEKFKKEVQKLKYLRD